MSAEQNKELVIRQIEEVWNRGRGSAALAEFWAAEANTAGREMNGIAQIGAHIDRMLDSLQNWRFEIHEAVAEGDKVVLHLTARFNYVKPIRPLEDIPAVGQPVERDQINIFTVRDGKIVHLHSVGDNLGARSMASAGAAQDARR